MQASTLIWYRAFQWARHAAMVAIALATSHALGAEWSYTETTDPMSGARVWVAELRSANSLALNPPYSGENAVRLFARSGKPGKFDVIVAAQKGQIVCSPLDECQVRVRFGDGKAVKFSAGHPTDRSSNVLFLSPEREFLAAASKAQRILVELTFFQSGTHVVEFTTTAPLRLPPEAAKAQERRPRSAPESLPHDPNTLGSTEQRYAVQVGVFATATQARETRLVVEKLGLKTYTFVRDGRIVVRVGPFVSRADALEAAGKIKDANLPAAVMNL